MRSVLPTLEPLDINLLWPGVSVAQNTRDAVGLQGVSAEIVPFDPSTALSGGHVTQDLVARQFSNEFDGKLVYCHSQGRWFLWDGSIWRRQDMPVAFHLSREVARRMSGGATNWKKMQEASFCRGVEAFSQADPVFRRLADDFDQDIFLMGTPDGTADLRTGDLFPPRQSDMITKTTAVSPTDFEECPRWIAFLKEATRNDDGFIRFLQQMAGYALTGDISEQVLFFIHGEGGRGKGVFLSTIQGIMGDYSVVAPSDALEAQKFAQHSTDVAMMRGARLVSANETDEGAAWNEKRIKSLTGGDRITARLMRRDNMTFTPQLTLVVIGNHQPALRTVDEAMRRRFNVIPFKVKPAQKDTKLAEKLREEWPAILRWMMNGCLDWQKNGFVRPPVVLEETARYFEDQNTIQEWIEERCIVDMDNEYIFAKSAALFADWSKYAMAAGVEPGSAKTFKPAMERLGFRTRKTNSGRDFHNISLRSHPSDGVRDPDVFG
jgi:putative DNA primase/helicase